MHDHLAFAIQALRAGANGYVTKSSDPQLMVEAVRRRAGRRSGAQSRSGQRLARRRQIHAPSQPTLGLSVREFDIFRLIASGKNHEDIAQLLRLSVKTVTNQHSLIRQKLGIDSDIELFQLAVECGAVEARVRRS